MQELGQSLEDYLEAILILEKQLDTVHNIDIASYLGFSKSSVSHALKILQADKLIQIHQDKSVKLQADKLIQIHQDKSVKLTREGQKTAQHTYQRHEFFTKMLQQIGVNKFTAEEDACRLEHVISDETFQAIKKYYEFHE